MTKTVKYYIYETETGSESNCKTKLKVPPTDIKEIILYYNFRNDMIHWV